jgi:hypothetical protein
MRNDFKSKCACIAGGIGICLCIIFMSLAIVGTTAVGISKNADMNGMSSGDSSSSSSSMSSMKPSDTTANSSSNNTSESSQNIIVNFFSGVGGQVILLLSYGAMFASIWSSRISNRKLVLPISIIGAIILYISMYNYYSVALEVTGAIILAFVYVSAFSYRVARTVKLA